MTSVDRQPITQPSTSPTSKVAAGGAAGSVTVLIVYILSQVHVVVPAEVGSAITVLLSFLASYFVKDRSAAARRPVA